MSCNDDGDDDAGGGDSDGDGDGDGEYILITRAERQAWSRRHPGHRLQGCMFHFDQVNVLSCTATQHHNVLLVSTLHSTVL